MARNVYVADHMHAFEDGSRGVLDQGINRVAPVEIADGAWLGQNVVVGPGVRIGHGAVIGANAVVLEDVPDFTVAVGAPARVVRSFAGASPSSLGEPAARPRVPLPAGWGSGRAAIREVRPTPPRARDTRRWS